VEQMARTRHVSTRTMLQVEHGLAMSAGRSCSDYVAEIKLIEAPAARSLNGRAAR
jgi:hypothetical protein